MSKNIAVEDIFKSIADRHCWRRTQWSLNILETRCSQNIGNTSYWVTTVAQNSRMIRHCWWRTQWWLNTLGTRCSQNIENTSYEVTTLAQNSRTIYLELLLQNNLKWKWIENKIALTFLKFFLGCILGVFLYCFLAVHMKNQILSNLYNLCNFRCYSRSWQLALGNYYKNFNWKPLI